MDIDLHISFVHFTSSILDRLRTESSIDTTLIALKHMVTEGLLDNYRDVLHINRIEDCVTNFLLKKVCCSMEVKFLF